MRAYLLIKLHRSKDYHPIYDKICRVKGVIKSDEVFGPWDFVIKIECKDGKELSEITDKITACGDVRDTVTMFVFSD